MRAIIRDMIKICKKHNIIIVAHDEGNVNIRLANDKYLSSVSDFRFTPEMGSIDDVIID